MGDRPVAFHPNLARIAGSLKAGLFLGQAMYWQNRVPPGRDGWWWHTQDEWEEETTLGRRECETVRKTLKHLGLLQVVKRGMPCKTWYRVNLERLAVLLVELVDQREYPADDDGGGEEDFGDQLPPDCAPNRQTVTTKKATLKPPKNPNILYTEITTEKPQGGYARNEQTGRDPDRPGVPPDSVELVDLAEHVAGKVAIAQGRDCTASMVGQWLAQLRLMERSGLSVEAIRAGWEHGRQHDAYRVAVMTPGGFNKHHEGLVAAGLERATSTNQGQLTCQGVSGNNCTEPATLGSSGRNTHCQSCFAEQGQIDIADLLAAADSDQQQ